jgi:hypothetical protein
MTQLVLTLFFRSVFAVILLLSMEPVAGKEPQLRQWRSADGSSVLGRLNGADESTVVLEVKGREFRLACDRLSEDDRAYVDAWLAENPQAKAVAPVLADLPPWPVKYDGVGKAVIEVVEEEDSRSSYVYQTEHYIFAFEVKVSRKNLEEIAAVFESVSAALMSLPLKSLHPSFERKRRFPAAFFSTQAAYEAAGGPKGSVGAFSIRRQDIIIRLDVLLANENRGSRMPARERYQVLVHELVHQAMFPAMWDMPLWYVEGVAEYMSAAHFATARYDFRNIGLYVRQHINRFILLEDWGGYTLPSLEKVTALDMESWQADNVESGKNSFKKYGASLLLVHWFHHRYGAGKAQEIDAYLNGIVGQRRFGPPGMVDKKELKEIERAMVGYWKTQGVQIRFAAR